MRLCAGGCQLTIAEWGNWGCGNSGAGVCWRTVEDGCGWFFAPACVEICWRWVHWQRGVRCVGRLLTAKSRSARGESHLLADMGGCLTSCPVCLGVGVILWNGCGIQGWNFLKLLLQESEMAARCHCRNWLSVYVLVWPLYIITFAQWWLARQGGSAVVGDHCPEWECKVRLFSCDVVNILLKTNGGRGGRDRNSNFVGGVGRQRQKV